MKKQFFLSVAMIAVSLIGLTACNDNDSDNNNREVSINADHRVALASVLNALTGMEFSDTTDIDFENRTFDATYGELNDSSRLWERCVKVRSAVLAESYFRALAGSATGIIKDTDDGCMIDLTNLDSHSSGRKQNFGKLTFHRGSDADNVGYVDVEIDCIHGFERISYKTQEQWGENGGFESPISYGEVFYGDGLYWICVREAIGNNDALCGVLVNMQPGRGEDWTPIYEKEKDAGWRPNSHCHRETYNAILDYINLCGDTNLKRHKKRIMAQPYGNKVFPCGCIWHLVGSKWNMNPSIEGPGFGDTEHDGYCHWAVEPWGVNGIVIIIDAWEGNYRASRARWWRRVRMCCTSVEKAEAEEPDAYMSKGDWKRRDVSSFRYFDYYYTDDDDFGNFLSSSMVYTARTEMFTNRIPNGFTKIDI